MYRSRPAVTSAQLRPRSWWYWLPLSVAVFGIAAGVGFVTLGAGMAARAALAIPVLEGEFQDFVTGRAVSFDLESGREYGVFAPGEPGTAERPSRCELTPDGALVTPLADPPPAFVDEHVWFQVYDVTVDESGAYTVRCDPMAAGNQIALGLAPVDGPSQDTGALASLVIGTVVAGGAALAAGAGATVLGVRRSRYRSRLEAALAEQAAAPPYRAGPLVRW